MRYLGAFVATLVLLAINAEQPADQPTFMHEGAATGDIPHADANDVNPQPHQTISSSFSPTGDDDADARRQMELMDANNDEKATKQELLDYIIAAFYKDKKGAWLHNHEHRMTDEKHVGEGWLPACSGQRAHWRPRGCTRTSSGMPATVYANL